MVLSPRAATIRTVGQLMTAPAVTAEGEESLQQAGRRMTDRGVGSVVVVEGNRPVGILTERDLARACGAGAESSRSPVAQWMTPGPDCVSPDLEVAEAWRRLAAHGYRHIPVVSGGELEGIVLRDVMSIAQLRPVQGTFTDVPRGLKGVVVAETEVGDVRGLEGFYHYRQYSAVELAQRRSLEDVWHLLMEGGLPTRSQREAFTAEIRSLRQIPAPVAGLLPGVARACRTAGPLDGLRAAISLVASSEGYPPSLDVDRATLRRQALQVSALVPTLIAALYRLGQDREPVGPHPELGYAANYLYMLSGDVPGPELARAIEQYLISTIDHGFNASTFTARVVTSTGADLGAAVVAALGALSGPLHGGAPSRALETLDAIGTPDRAEAWIRDAVGRGERIMGFGHAVYKTDDPRSVMLREVAERLGGPLVELATQVEGTVVDVLAELKPGRDLYPNVELYAGVVMEGCGLPRPLFTPTFASSRVIGWCTHILEQAADNRIIRPSSRYIGPPPPQPVPDPR